jgi:predicted HTH transcriptional regulator
VQREAGIDRCGSERVFAQTRWSYMGDVIENRATFEDIDERTIKIYLRKVEEAGRLPDIDGLYTPELLEKLRLAENGQIKRAAIVLFGKRPRTVLSEYFRENRQI